MIKFEELSIGQSYQMSRVFTPEEVKQFAVLSYDNNPIHIDEEFAKNSIFGRPIVHGFLAGSLFSAIIGTKFPGAGSIYLNQNMTFRGPVFIGSEIVAKVSVKELYPEKRRVLLETLCLDDKENILIEGTALIKLP